MAGSLSGIKVLEVSQGISGPFCAMLLSDGGCDITKVEPPEGDYTRALGPPFVGRDSALFLSINRNKRSVVLNLSDPKGKEILLKLAAEADVIIADFLPPIGQPSPPGYEEIVELNSNVIYCSMSPFGEKGPLRNRAGSELSIQAESNVSGGLGVIGEPPLRLGTDEASCKAAVIAYQGVLAALFYRLRTGVGQKLSVSSMGAVLLAKGCQIAGLGDPDVWAGHLLSWTNPPDHGYQTKDSPLYLSLSRGQPIAFQRRNEARFADLLSDLGMAEYIGDPRFANGGRDSIGLTGQAQELRPIWEKAFRNKTAAEVIEIFRRYDYDAVPFNDYASLDQDPQVKALGIIKEAPFPGFGDFRFVLTPWTFSATPEEHLRRPPPSLGEHTRDILQELGYSPAEVTALVRKGVAQLQS